MKRLFWLLSLVIGLAVGCSSPQTPAPSPVASSSSSPHEHEHHHEHHAPHGGTLVVFGDEFAHLELVFDSDSGRLEVYLLDGEAENPVRSAAEELTLVIDSQSHQLKAQASELTGETVGDTSMFAASLDSLKGKQKFSVVIPAIELRGKSFEKVAFNYPEGNE